MYTAFGANIILTSGGRLLLQRKTAGYRYTAYIGTLCLVGGGWTEAEDVNPRHTALRELAEELHPPALYAHAAEALRYVGAFALTIPAEIATWKPRPRRPTHLLTFAFALELPTLDGARLLEGELARVDDPAALAEPFCWGHDHILSAWAAERGIALPRLPLETRVACRRQEGAEPARYSDLDLDGLLINPLAPPRPRRV